MSRRSLIRHRMGAFALSALAIVSGITACAEPRLSLNVWEEVWQQTVDRVAQMENGEIPEDECTQVLAYLREQRPHLSPLPAEGLEKPVNSWFELAQAAFFECPPDGERVKGWTDAFEQLRVIEAEVAAVLDRQR